MIVVKGWVQHPNFSVSGKCGNILNPHQAMMLIAAARDGDATGRIHLTSRSERFEYVRRDDGRIVITQIE